MHAHLVLAHPEPRSFNGHLQSVAARALTDDGWSVSSTDLYADGFDPAEGAVHYAKRSDPARFDAQAEQRHAADTDSIPGEVAAEIARLDRSDLVILQYPMWWHMPPAMLKGWFDRVFVYGGVYKSDMRFEKGRFVGKRAMLSVTVATSAETYAHDGRSGDIDLLLWPIHFTLAYVGFDVLPPHVAYGVESGLRYSDPSEIEARLERIVSAYRTRLQGVMDDVPIPFNRMAEWGADGRIVADAPVHSPFIRRRRDLPIA